MSMVKFISFRLSQEENAAVKAAAKHNGMAVGVWVRAITLDAVKARTHIEVETTLTRKNSKRKAA